MSDLKKENFDEETGIPPELYAGFDENTPGEGPDAPDDVTVTLSENPYASDGKKTSDIVRLFYIHNIPVIPVVSKRGILLGILKKDDVISELSDLERSHKYNIDQFVTKLAKKMSFEELLQYGEIREFPVINIFGEGQGRWTRVQLFAAADSASAESGDGMKAQKDEQVLEWMIYLILEHIPRALYALNENGKTIFYNSHFEHIYTGKIGNDVDVLFVEQTIKDAGKNEVLSGYNLPEIYFYNKDFDLNYEKIPLLSGNKRVGYLIYFDNQLTVPGAGISGMSLDDILSSVERQVIVENLNAGMNVKDAADKLKISKQSLVNRMKKLEIDK